MNVDYFHLIPYLFAVFFSLATFKNKPGVKDLD